QAVALRPGALPTESEAAPHFAAYVRDLLPRLVGDAARSGGLQVHTTLDLGMQRKAEAAVQQQLAAFGPRVAATNAALVAISPQSGEILAMVGSPDFNKEAISGQVNNALALNSPGSSLKPVTYL